MPHPVDPPLVLMKSRAKLFALAIYFAAFTGFGGLVVHFMGDSDKLLFLGWVAIAVGAVGTTIMFTIALFVRQGPVLSLSAHGVDFIRDDGAHLAWDQFEDTFIFKIGLSSVLCLVPNKPDSLPSQLRGKLKHMDGKMQFEVPLYDLTPPYFAVISYLKPFLPKMRLVRPQQKKIQLPR